GNVRSRCAWLRHRPPRPRSLCPANHPVLLNNRFPPGPERPGRCEPAGCEGWEMPDTGAGVLGFGGEVAVRAKTQGVACNGGASRAAVPYEGDRAFTGIGVVQRVGNIKDFRRRVAIGIEDQKFACSGGVAECLAIDRDLVLPADARFPFVGRGGQCEATLYSDESCDYQAASARKRRKTESVHVCLRFSGSAHIVCIAPCLPRPTC